MLDEKALRRPTFAEGSRVKLADGQEWTFPKPRIRFKPRVVDGRVEIDGGATFGPEFDEKLEMLFGLGEIEGVERLRLQFEVAVRLLSTNYDLPRGAVGDLLVLEAGDPASEERWESITNVMLGISPKPSPAT